MKKFILALLLILPINLCFAKTSIKGEVIKIDIEGKKHVMTVKFTDTETNNPIIPDDLKTIHTEKVHLLIIDDALEDYSHIHPTPSEVAGEYMFEWHPKKMAHYKIWADIHPIKSDTQEYVIIDLKNKAAKKGKVDRKEISEILTQDIDFQITYSDKKIKAGNSTMIHISMTNKDGEKFTNLEEIMGAYAHLVAFSEDFKTIAHIHPMNEGSTDLSFHFSPSKKGFYKLFLQIKTNGEERFIPFGVKVF